MWAEESVCGRLRLGGVGAMYPVVYWTGVLTFLVWSAYSAYSAIIGL
jgi:hypothetical protein